MDKCRSGILKLYQITVSGLFMTILLLLGIFAAYSTSYILADAREVTYFVEDHMLLNLLISAGVMAAVVLVKKNALIQKYLEKLECDEQKFRTCRAALFFTGAVLAIVWVLSTQYRAGADQAQIQKAVYLLHLEDYSMFEEGGYLAKYPNQLGFFWFSYLYSKVFGMFNYTGLQLFNVAGLILIYKAMADICRYLEMKRSAQLMVIGSAILFIPLTMYTSFVYGNIPGLAFALEALSREMKFFSEKKKTDIILSAILIAFAVQLKSNYLIFLIGMVIYGVMVGIQQKNARMFAVPVLLIIGILCSSIAVKGITKHVTGYSLDQGASAWSWIAMGLQDGKRAPGWYNGYNSGSYTESGYDPAIQAEMAKESIRESIEHFSNNKWEAVEFFTKKTASQWNNPTFQAFWNIQIRSMGVTQSQWNWEMTGVAGMNRWAQILNLMQFLILMGSALYFLFPDKKANSVARQVPAMIFVGGFIFHLFWEAKCQYTISYFVLLFPYAVGGFNGAAEWILAGIENRRSGSRMAGKSILEALLERGFTGVMYAFIVVNACILLYGGGKLEYLREDTVGYEHYLEEARVSPEIKEEAYQSAIRDRGKNWFPNIQ